MTRIGRAAKLLAAACALLFVVSLLPASSAQTPAGISPAFLITTDSTGPSKKLEAFDAVTIAAVDLNGDGIKEILAQNDNNNFYVFHGATGALIAELVTNHPNGWGARTLAGPAVGDLNGNGLPDIVLTNSAGWVTVFEARPKSGTPNLEFVKLWERLMDPHKEDPDYANNMAYGEWNGHPGLDGPAFLADTNGDGRDEVFLQLDDMPGLYKLNPDGSVAWWAHHSDGNSGPVVAYLTGTGGFDVAYPSDGGNIHIYNAKTMQYRCGFSAASHGASPGSISTSPTAADVTGDGRMELIFGVRNVAQDRSQPDWIYKSHAYLFAIDSACKVVWKQTFDWGNPHVHMSPIPIDITGNGINDVIFQDWNTIGHKPGNWEITGPANLFALNGQTGNLLWKVETGTYWSNKNLALADVTGNGAHDIVVNEDRGGRDGIGLYSVHGLKGGFIGAPSPWIVTRGPVVADLDGNGMLDILLPIHRGSSHCTVNKDIGCREGALQIYRTSSAATPHHSNSHVLNAQSAEPGNLQFSGVRGTEWWVEAEVRPGGAVTAVHARVGTGSWVNLNPTSWDSWARSIHAPEGSVVQLRATQSDGSTTLSDCYRWTAATTTTCPSATPPPPPPPPPTGEVTFDHRAGNEWWVEAKVTGGPTAVQAMRTGGTWNDLSLRSWGNWAGSFHIPPGSEVRFRAQVGGDWHDSCWYSHPGGNIGSCTTAPPPTTTSFDHTAGNEWWVEVVVKPRPTRVEAKAEGGTWQPLTLRDWGSWAGSFHIPPGQMVQFRAETSGTWQQSCWYTHPAGVETC